jgi:hypothetical protein
MGENYQQAPQRGVIKESEMSVRSNFKVGKTIAGFAFTTSRDPDGTHSRMLMETFAKTKERSEAKLVNSKKYFFSQGHKFYRLYSVHMTVMRELEFNLNDGMQGFPCLDDDEDIEPEVKKINGRIVLEDPFDLPNPAKMHRKRS